MELLFEFFLTLLSSIVEAFGRNARVVIGCTVILGVVWLLWLVS